MNHRRSALVRFLSLAAFGVTSFVAALLPAARAAGASDPQQMIRTAVDQVLATAYDTVSTQPLHERLRPILERYFDFTGATRRAIGPGWRNFTPEQQQRATELLTTLIIRSYSDKFEPGARPTITYASTITLDKKRRELLSSVTYAGKRYSVTYRVELLSEDNWRVYDLIIEGVSMVGNYRAQLDPLYKKGGADEVIRSLEKSLQQPVIAEST
ncbi:ABC transporter substrate-binding protein [Opitutaceae bacterium TAV4]|uniref:MlaC/ttg2D family ABC transporter substrate-binding protein n=1 Tax=Geminisphaera colitermitum TaxID=1148786 RepID=UPI000694E166|nr:ABC transporter substrate-binding protein [Geminisphaera colitermitum]RRK01477.1 ABC transporter substrate-binding protein [Opitutaceae bacterium TAV4]RRK01565.1 ABC transporter substrate-binding protein [Opitutaceae bacterium TAV3]